MTLPASAFPTLRQDANKESSSKPPKPHKVTKEHRERTRKDSESKGSSKELEREQAKGAKDAARKLAEGRLPKEEKAPPPKAAFKEPKLESLSPKGGAPPPAPPKASSKRPAAADSPKPSAKKPKKNSSKGARSAPGTSPRTSSSSFPDKKPAKDRSSSKGDRGKTEGESREARKALEVGESNSEDEASYKSEVSGAQLALSSGKWTRGSVSPCEARVCVPREPHGRLRELMPSASGAPHQAAHRSAPQGMSMATELHAGETWDFHVGLPLWGPQCPPPEDTDHRSNSCASQEGLTGGSRISPGLGVNAPGCEQTQTATEGSMTPRLAGCGSWGASWQGQYRRGLVGAGVTLYPTTTPGSRHT